MMPQPGRSGRSPLFSSYRLTVEYDGSRFAGWQVQDHQRTVQGVLLAALRRLFPNDEVTMQGAGRTDAGVHALAQVASLRCSAHIPVESTLAKLEKMLPLDVAILDLFPASPGFHARHDAEERAYRYQLTLRRSAFGKRYSWWIGKDIDLEAMGRAAELFVGRHDFAAFTRRARQAGSTLVEVNSCTVHPVEEAVLIRVMASHFLWGQVRRMVGSLVAIGRGEARAEDVSAWLRGLQPPPLPAAPAGGLFLEGVRYHSETWRLPPLQPIGLPAAFGSLQSGSSLQTTDSEAQHTEEISAKRAAHH